MTDKSLPPLPEPAIKSAHPLANAYAYGYHADQMRALQLATLEFAIALCKAEHLEDPADDCDDAYDGGVSDCIAVIRAAIRAAATKGEG